MKTIANSANSVYNLAKQSVNVASNLSNIAHNSIEQSITSRLIEKSIKYDDEQYKEFASYIDNQDYDINFDNLYNEKSFFNVKNDKEIQRLNDNKSLTITYPENEEKEPESIFIDNNIKPPTKIEYLKFIRILLKKKNLTSFSFKNYNYTNTEKTNSIISILSLKTTLHSMSFVEKDISPAKYLNGVVDLLKNKNIKNITIINYWDTINNDTTGDNNVFLKIFDKENNYNTIHFLDCVFLEPTKENPELDVFYSLRVETLTIHKCMIHSRSFVNILRNDNIKNLHLTKLENFFKNDEREGNRHFKLLILTINKTSNLSLLDISENTLTYDQISEILDQNNSINILHINKINFQDSDTEKFSKSVLLNNKILSLSYQNNNKQQKYYEKLKIICTGKFKELNFSSNLKDTIGDTANIVLEDTNESTGAPNTAVLDQEIITSLINTIITNNEIKNINLSTCFNKSNNTLLNGIFNSKNIQTLILNNNELDNTFLENISIDKDSPLVYLELNHNKITKFFKVEQITPNLNIICIDTAHENIFPNKPDIKVNINLIKIKVKKINITELVNLLSYNNLKTIECQEIDISDMIQDPDEFKRIMIINNSLCNLSYNNITTNLNIISRLVHHSGTIKKSAKYDNSDRRNIIMKIFEICTFFNNLYNTQKTNLSLNDKQLTTYSLFKIKQYCLNIPFELIEKYKSKIMNYLEDLNIRNKYQRFLNQTNKKVVFYLNGMLYEDENGVLWYPNGRNVPINKYYPLSYYINFSEIISNMPDILEFDEIDVNRSRNINIITGEDETISRINKDPESASYMVSNQRLKIKNNSESLFPALAEKLSGLASFK
jgi:hypothetical protein